MVLVTVGTTTADFSRLLREVDQLVGVGLLGDVIAQAAGSYYQPDHYPVQGCLAREELQTLIHQSEFVISHGGAATLDECLGLRKRVIVVPRQARFKESTDDHQFQIAEFLAARNRVLLVREISELRLRVGEVRGWQPEFRSNTTAQQLVAAVREFVAAIQMASEGRAADLHSR